MVATKLRPVPQVFRVIAPVGVLGTRAPEAPCSVTGVFVSATIGVFHEYRDRPLVILIRHPVPTTSGEPRLGPPVVASARPVDVWVVTRSPGEAVQFLYRRSIADIPVVMAVLFSRFQGSSSTRVILQNHHAMVVNSR